MNLLTSDSGAINGGGWRNSIGVRPVIVLSSEVELVDSNSDGILEIN